MEEQAEYKNEKKYYVPEPEEFFVGLEYETKYTWDPNRGYRQGVYPPKLVEADEWQKKVFTEHDSVAPSNNNMFTNYFHIINELTDTFTEPLVRVKYLDEENLNELGFVKPKELGYHGIYDVSAKYFHKDFHRIDVEPQGKEWIHIEHDGRILYHGICKNKSELIRIFKNIGLWTIIQPTTTDSVSQVQ